MTRTLTWLHISDLHARLRDDWDARAIADSLMRDLKAMQKEYGLRPDLIFFTGDIAYGATANERMEDQYEQVRRFLDLIRKSFEPEVPLRDFYLVPGNHDVDRNQITPDQTSWLRDKDRTLADILGAIRDGKRQWHAWMERLSAYRAFLLSYGLLHLSPEDPRLIWADTREFAGSRIGIVGLNSAWSCADNEDKGKIWCGIEWQIEELARRVGPADFSIALIHHPGNWFTNQEDPKAMRLLRHRFPLVLHGHEHADWVEVSFDGRIVVSAAACYQCSWMDNGYNIGCLDLEQGTGVIRLRRWDAAGRGWVARDIAGQTRNGAWSLANLSWAPRQNVTTAREATQVAAISTGQVNASSESAESTNDHYTRRFCRNVVDQNDILELFGCDIPRELQRHNLSIAYISLNLSTTTTSQFADDDVSVAAEAELSDPAPPDEDEPFFRTAPLEGILDGLPASSPRLIIHGPAGAGKTTLLRWCAIHAARNVLNMTSDAPHVSGVSRKMLTSYDKHSSPTAQVDSTKGWRSKIPILVRLRDCPSGRLPPANELPRLLAKHLPSPPTNWATTILERGHALLLLDGVDEIHRDKRYQLAREIELLIRTYPHCVYIVSTRPGAVEDDWLKHLQFTEAHVQPMGRAEREDFIDRWYRSAAIELRLRPRPGEDLIETARRLKAELADQQEIAALATNPLLCAMICALYRERQERLPETSPELCEALCYMLIHRRERETPGLEESHFNTAWRDLKYVQKKGLLADLAWKMIEAGESSSDMNAAQKLVADALQSTPGHAEAEAPDLLQALIERSGLLRLDADDRVEFLHNTLKEYLAATLAVENGDWRTLAEHADDTAWQPAILFALSLAGASFNSALVSGLLGIARARSPRSGSTTASLTKAERAELAEVKQREFFLVRCRSVAKRMASDVSAEIDRLAQRFLPPASMSETEALALIGPRVLRYSARNMSDARWWARQTPQMAIRCLRLLRRIGGSQARSALETINRLPSGSVLLYAEWMLACSDLVPQAIRPWPFSDTQRLVLSNTNVRDLRPITGLSTIQDLSLNLRRVQDLTPISGLSSLRTLNLSGGRATVDLSPLAELYQLEVLRIVRTQLSDIAALSNLKKLKFLHLSWISSPRVSRSPLANLAPLEALTSLQNLSVIRSSVTDLSPLETLIELRELCLSQTLVRDFGVLSRLTELVKLVADDTLMEDLTFASELRQLQVIAVGATQVSKLEPVARLSHLKSIDLNGTQVCDVSALAGLESLESLNLTHTSVSDLRPLGGLASLKSLRVSDTQVNDLAPLKPLTGLRDLYLANTPVSDLSALRTMESLRILDLEGTQVETFDDVPGNTLSFIDVSRAGIRDLRRLENFEHLKSIIVDDALAKSEIERFSSARPDVQIRVVPRDPSQIPF